MDSSSHHQAVALKRVLVSVLMLMLLSVMLSPVSLAQEATEEAPVPEVVVTESVSEAPEEATETPVATDAAPVETEAAPVETEVPTEAADEDSPGEATPAAEVTEEAPVEDDPEVVETPEAEVTAEPEPEATTEAPAPTEETAEIVEETPVATEENPETDVPEVQVIESFMDDFTAWTGAGWLVAGWAIETDENSNAYLSSNLPGASATVLNFVEADFAFSASVKVAANNTLSIFVRESETDALEFMVSDDGDSRLYVNGELLDSASAPEGTVAGEGMSIGIQSSGSVVVLNVNGTPVLATTDTAILSGNSVRFMTGVNNTDSVAIDDVNLVKAAPEASIALPVEEAPEADVEEVPAEVTPEAEVTVEPEMTPEAEVTAEPEMTPEAPAPDDEDSAVVDENIVLSADFEDGMAGWLSGAGIAEVGDDNHALLLATGQSLAPEADPALSHFAVSGDVMLMSENNGLSLISGAYTLNINSGGVSLSIDGQDFAADETALALNSWYRFSFSVVGDVVTVMMDETELFNFSSDAAADSNVLFSANDALMLDNMVISDESDAVEPVATGVPGDEVTMKMAGSLSILAEALQNGDLQAAGDTIEGFRIATDESGRVLVELRPAAEATVSDLIALAESVGGAVIQVNDDDIEAYVPAEALFALAGAEIVDGILQPSRAVATGPTAGNSSDVVSSSYFSAFDSLGIQPWHAANITGTGIKVGVIDGDFGTATPPATGEYICLAPGQPTYTAPGAPAGTTTAHGLSAVEVICDIAPDSDVYLYKAHDYDALAAAIQETIDDGMDVIVITLDSGADASKGDGTGDGGINDPYVKIQTARNAGIAVIAAAGNNNKRYVTIQKLGAGTSNIDFSIPEGFGGSLKVGWDQEGSVQVTANAAHSGGGAAGGQLGTSGFEMAIGACTAPQVDGGGRCNYDLSISTSSSAVVQVQLVPETNGDIDLILQDVDTLPNTGDEYADSDDVTWRTGNLARPADSPNAIAVGAICNDYAENFPILEHSSKGPKFAAGGGLAAVPIAPIVRSQTKPDIVSVSQVSTLKAGDATDCDSGYGGTSAAAAHVAGIVALLKSNTTNASMTGETTTSFSPDSAVAVDNLLDYLQTRATDMPFGADADGYDLQYGAGFSFLGSPSYDLARSANSTLLSDPDAVNGEEGDECTAGIVYAGQGNPGSASQATGSKTLPFQSIGQALNSIIADDMCVIVMPGEYGSTLVEGVTNAGVLVKSYNNAAIGEQDESIFWLVNGYYRTADSIGDTYGAAGLFFENGSVGVTFSGFNFIPVENYIFDVAGNDEFRTPGGVMFYQSEKSVIRDSTFGEVTLDGVTYGGWNGSYAIPVRVLDGSHGAQVFRNQMVNNTAAGSSFGSAVEVRNAGTNTNNATRVRVDENFIKGHSNTESLNTINDWAAIVWTDNSAVDIVNNQFVENVAETIVQVRTDTEGSTLEQRILGNMFLNNQTQTDDPELFASAGALISAYFSPKLFVMSNSFIKNVMDTNSNYGGLVVRGDAVSGTFAGSSVTNANNQTFEFHNNLVYFNTLNTNAGIINDTHRIEGNTPSYECRDTLQNDDKGFQHNWIYGNNSDPDTNDDGVLDDSSNDVQVCDFASLTVANQNLSTINPAGQFLGDDPSVLIADTEPLYYAFRQINDVPTFADGIDAGDQNINANVTAVYDTSAVAPNINAFPVDVGGVNIRILPVNIWAPVWVNDNTLDMDIGAYEFSPLNIVDDDLDVDTQGPFFEDGGVIEINLLGDDPVDNPNVEGGFGTLTFAIDDDAAGNNEFAKNFGTQCGLEFTDANRGSVLTGTILRYCPPEHFYTDDGSSVNPDINGIWEDSVRITYTVRDQGGAAATGAVFFTIDPTADTNIGSGQSYTYTAAAGQATVAVELRPFVRFNNFGINFLQGSEADFPYRYENPVIDPLNDLEDNESLYTQVDLNNAFTTINNDGTIDLPITGGQTGYLDFSYDVKDVDNDTVATNTVRVRIVSQIPVEGLYDDSSFAFTYRDGANEPGGSWLAKNATNTINRTYHESREANDYASVNFIGTGFVLYMNAETIGGDWELRINDLAVDAPGWTALVDSSGQVYTATFDAGQVVCSTRTKASTINVNYLSNYGVIDYTVSCDGLTAGPTQNITMHNRGIRRTMSVDAISILNSSTPAAYDPFLPGIYDVDQLTLRGLFNTNEWQQASLYSYSQRLRYETIKEGTLTSDADIRFSFEGATGFAVETHLERYAASYTICVHENIAPGNTNGDGVCQEFDNSPLAVTPRAYNVFRPFSGYDPSKTYNVEIKDIVVDANGKMSIDSIIVFSDAMLPVAPLPEGITEDENFEYFIKGPDTSDWTFSATDFLASNRTLTSMNLRATKAGPFMMFQVPAASNTVYYNYKYTRRESQMLMVCVDRAYGTVATDFANCLLVNTRPNALQGELSYQVFNSSTGVLEDPTANGVGEYDDGNNKRDVIQPVNGLLIIEESMFDRPWDNPGDHTVEIFSVTNQTFNLDKVTVLDNTAPLKAGQYEETVTNLQFYDSGDVMVNPVPYDRITNPFTETFTQVTGSLAIRDSGKSIIHSREIGASIYFQFEGTGLAPLFRADRKSDAVRVCLKAGDHNYLTVKNTPDFCQTFDNQSTGTLSQSERPILGLEQLMPAGTPYSVVITMLDDNNDPAAHTLGNLPLNMWFDGFVVLDNDWTGLNVLLPGMEYVADYGKREEENNFQFYGTTWRELRSLAYSQRDPGASVIFRTNNADALTLNRNLFSSAPMTVCAAPEANPLNRNCERFSNSGFTRSVPVTFYLNNTGDTSPHVVSISVEGNNPFYLPGIELKATGALLPGVYDDNDPSIFYEKEFQEFIINGNMALDNGATVYWADVGAVSNNQYLGFRRRITTTGANSGVESLEFDIKNGEWYSFSGVFFFTTNYAGELNLQLVEGNTVIAELPVGKRPDTSETLLRYRLLPVRMTYLSDADRTVKLRFVSSTAGTFEIDDASAVTGGQWEFVSNYQANGRYYTRSTKAGASLNFSFTGTGFSLGTVMDRRGGELEICYDDDATFDEGVETGNDEQCFIYQQESSFTIVNAGRTVVGLPQGTYYVRARDLEDGYVDFNASNDFTPRSSIFRFGSIGVDQLEIFGADDVPAAITDSVIANEDADTNNDGDADLVLLPQDRWKTIDSALAASYTDGSYVISVNPRNGFTNRNDVGATGVIELDLDTYSEASVVLFTGRAGNSRSKDFLVCLDNVNGEVVYNSATREYDLINSTDCVLRHDMPDSTQLVLNSQNMPGLGVSGTDRTLSFRSLEPSEAFIDGYQVFYDTVLQAGFYEDTLLTGVATYDIADWETEYFPFYSSQSGLVTEQNGEAFQFQMEGTGFTLLTRMFSTAGQISVVMDGTGANDFNTTLDLNSALTLYKAGLTFAGLPLDTYTVTLTTQSDFKFVLDGIHVYGELESLGSLYDDNLVNISNSQLYLSYGPGNSWSLVEGPLAIRYIERTYHRNNDFGATVTFEVGETTPATGIIIYDGFSSTRDLEVCWRDATTPANVTCNTVDLAGDNTGRVQVTAPTPGHYYVTLTNKSRSVFMVDAIQVLEGDFGEGIYNIDFLNAAGAFSGNWNISKQKAVGADNGSAMEFDFRGIGFSIKLAESASSANTYNLCVETVALACDVLDENYVNPTGSGTHALTVMGLMQNDGSAGTYTVRLTNTDVNNRDLTVNEVHVMGAKDNLQIATQDAVENDDTRIRYLPFGINELIVDRSNRPSGGNETRMRAYGASVYFEFQGDTVFEYVRQIATFYGDVEICYGQINASPATNSGNTADCTVVTNSNGNSYQTGTTIPTGLNCNAPGCWAVISSQNYTRYVTFDFVRLLDLANPIGAGTYDDSFAAFYNFEQTGADPDTYETEPGDVVLINAQDVANTRARGGSFRVYEDSIDGANASALNGGMFFQMTGTGFSVDFYMDRYADAVNICYRRNSVNAQDTINNGYCQTYDNYSLFTGTKTRSILGLPLGTYGVAIQMLPDNGTPTAHNAAQLPLKMQIDAVTVYDDEYFGSSETNWVSPATPATNALQPGTVYEFNYNDRVADNNFLYYGSGWRTWRNGLYSESNYDQVRTMGSGIVFRTSGANAAIIRRNLNPNYADLYICATPLAVNPLTIESAPVCQVSSADGFGFRQPVVVQFGSTDVAEYVVSIVTLEAKLLGIDTLELFDTTAPLPEGTYDNLYPGLFYDTEYMNLVENGEMELAGSWDDIGSITQTQSVLRYGGLRSLAVTANNLEGVESQPFDLVTGEAYTLSAYINISSGKVRMSLPGVAVVDDITLERVAGKWQLYRADFVADTNYTGQTIEFLAVDGDALFYLDNVAITQGGQWEVKRSAGYVDGSYTQSLTRGAAMTFSFTGTGFQIGAPLSVTGGNMQVCYDDDASFDESVETGDAQSCFIYDQESRGVVRDGGRTIVNLPQNTYYVRVKDAEDGKTSLLLRNPDTPRNTIYPGVVQVDFVKIFDDTSTQPVIEPGYYNDTATDSNGDSYLKFFPDDNWVLLEGAQARFYSESSYHTTAASSNGRRSNRTFGATMSMKVDVAPGTSTTVILYSSYRATTLNSKQLLVCADSMDGKVLWDGTNYLLEPDAPATCFLTNALTKQNIIVLDATDLEALGVAGTHSLSFSTLGSGYFDIDAVQVISGNILAPGIYDDFLPDSILDFNTPASDEINSALQCNAATDWCRKNNFSAYGNSEVIAGDPGSTLDFSFAGTGFSVITGMNSSGVDTRICFVPRLSGETIPDDELPYEGNPSLAQSAPFDYQDVWCDTVTTDTGVNEWKAVNAGRIKPISAQKYGFAYYGMPIGEYRVEVRLIDNSITFAGREVLKIDAIAVFKDAADVNNIMEPGLYDDVASEISYEPVVSWVANQSFLPPPSGPLNKTEHTTRQAGSLMQLYVDGNAMTIYQRFSSLNTGDARICLVVTNTAPLCDEAYAESLEVQTGNFSQRYGSGYAIPIMFYGLGQGENVVIVENREHNKYLNIDAILVQN